jgi:transcriptional regulator with XRE-family HTH domain
VAATTRHSPQVAAIGSRLRRLRKERHLSQTELARQIGIQQSDLSRMEKGEYRVSLENLFKILSVLELDVTEFFQEQSAPARPAPVMQPLSQQDMQTLQLLRALGPESRREVQEFLEFKVRKEAVERRAREARERARFGS